MCKDDEMTSDVYNSTYLDRVKAVNPRPGEGGEARRASTLIYFCSITDEPSELVTSARARRSRWAPTAS